MYAIINPGVNALREPVYNDEMINVFPKHRKNKGEDSVLKNIDNLESLDKKSVLEKIIIIRASVYRFEDKIKYYRSYTNNKNQKKKEPR